MGEKKNGLDIFSFSKTWFLFVLFIFFSPLHSYSTTLQKAQKTEVFYFFFFPHCYPIPKKKGIKMTRLTFVYHLSFLYLFIFLPQKFQTNEVEIASSKFTALFYIFFIEPSRLAGSPLGYQLTEKWKMFGLLNLAFIRKKEILWLIGLCKFVLISLVSIVTRNSQGLEQLFNCNKCNCWYEGLFVFF